MRLTNGRRRAARARAARRGRAVHARRVDLRSRPDRVRRDRLRAAEVRAVRIHRGGRCLTSRSTATPITVEPGATLLDACRAERRRRADAVLRRDAASEERVPHLRRRARRQSSARARMLAAGRGRHGRAHADRPHARTPASSCSSCSRRRPSSTGRRTSPHGSTSTEPSPARFGDDAATVHQPATIDNDLYVRDYGRCILCYKCVDACGEQWQNTFAISVAGRGFDAHISTEWDVGAPRLGLRLLRQLHRGVPHRARSRRRPSSRCATTAPGTRTTQTVTTTVCALLRRRVQPRAARAGQPHREGDEPLRSLDHARQPLHQGPLRLHPRRRRVSATRRRSTRCRGG